MSPTFIDDEDALIFQILSFAVLPDPLDPPELPEPLNGFIYPTPPQKEGLSSSSENELTTFENPQTMKMNPTIVV